MSHRVHILPAAYRDSWRIFYWIQEQSQRGADRWYEAFLAAANELSDRPERRPLAAEAKRLGQPIRQAFFKTAHGQRYRLIYLVVADEVQVLRVRAPGQRPLRRSDIE